jgi:proteasome alpha subunit
VEREMVAYLKQQASAPPSLEQACGIALRTWALGDRSQRKTGEDKAEQSPATTEKPAATDATSLYAYLRDAVTEKTVECALLDRNQPGSSKYRVLTPDELGRLLPKDVGIALS